MIEVRNLTKQYRDLTAVDNISFSLKKGEILGFLGPNGAGKTTTMRMITGYLSPTRGEVFVDGRSVLDEPLRAKRRIGYLPEHPPLYLDMTVRDYLHYVAELKDIHPRDISKEISKVSEQCGISNVSHRLIRYLSKGYRQRVGLAQALLGDPALLILDEPTVGLDPAQIREVRELIRQLAEKHTVILSTHILSEVNMICDRVIIIHQGKLRLDERLDSLSLKNSEVDKVKVELEKDVEGASEKLSKVDGVESVEELSPSRSFELHLKKGSTPSKVIKELIELNLPILSYTPSTPTLEDIFLKVISEEA